MERVEKYDKRKRKRRNKTGGAQMLSICTGDVHRCSLKQVAGRLREKEVELESAQTASVLWAESWGRSTQLDCKVVT
jgi:hypothetical protein